MKTLTRIRIPLLLLLLNLGSCGSSEQFERPGTWKLPPAGQGANDANLRAMLVDPHDLVAGVGEPASLGTEAVRPVELLLKGRRQPLPTVNASSIGIGGSSGGGGGAPAAGVGGGQQ
jgi:hypothetical protein